MKKKKKVKNFLIRAVKFYILPDTSFFQFSENTNIILKKRLHARGKVLMGPCTYTIKRKKFLKSFVKLI